MNFPICSCYRQPQRVVLGYIPAPDVRTITLTLVPQDVGEARYFIPERDHSRSWGGKETCHDYPDPTNTSPSPGTRIPVHSGWAVWQIRKGALPSGGGKKMYCGLSQTAHIRTLALALVPQHWEGGRWVVREREHLIVGESSCNVIETGLIRLWSLRPRRLSLRVIPPTRQNPNPGSRNMYRRHVDTEFWIQYPEPIKTPHTRTPTLSPAQYYVIDGGCDISQKILQIEWVGSRGAPIQILIRWGCDMENKFYPIFLPLFGLLLW